MVRMEKSTMVVMTEKSTQSSSRQMLVMEQNRNMGKETNYLSDTDEVIFSIGNRKKIIKDDAKKLIG